MTSLGRLDSLVAEVVCVSAFDLANRGLRLQLPTDLRLHSAQSCAASETLTCYLTRGDSAQIPQSELARGAAPDSSRWWIDTIEDDAIFAHVGPGPWPPSTLTEILSLWRPRPARP